MTGMILCNSSAVGASTIADDGDDGTVFDRVVTLCMGMIHDDGTHDIVAGLTLTADEAREIAQELLDAAARVDGPDPLPADVILDSTVPMGRC